MKTGLLTLCAVICFLFLQSGAGAAQPGMKVAASQSYIMGYRVEGDFVLPVMGVIENGVFMGVYSDEEAHGQPPSRGRLRVRGGDVQKFFADPETVAWVNESKKPKPRPVAPASPVIPGQVRLTGILRLTLEGQPCLVVSSPAGEKQYDLSVNKRLKETLPGIGARLYRGHLTGIVTRSSPRPTFYIQSGWFEPL